MLTAIFDGKGGHNNPESRGDALTQLDKTTWKKLRNSVDEIVVSLGYELWDIEFVLEGRTTVLRVYIDKPEKITVDDCAAASERISMMLDIEEYIAEGYTLEVSSPGMDRKLVSENQFRRFMDKLISIKLHKHVTGRKKFSGRLKDIDDETVLLFDESEKHEHKISRGDIKEARLVIEFKP